MRRVYIFLVLFLFLFALLGWKIYNHYTTYDIIAKFDNPRPLPKHIQVFYKGIKVGNLVSVKHSDDFENMLLKLRLPKSIILPDNIEAHLMIEKKRFHDWDYIELVRESKLNSESLNNLSSGSVIKGVFMIDARNFFANQDKESLEAIRNNLYLASTNLNTTLEGLSELFYLLQNVVKENSDSLKMMTKAFAHSGQNFQNFTRKLENVVMEEEIQESIIYFQKSLANFNTGMRSFSALSENLRCEIPVILESVKDILDDVETISSGVKSTLSGPFGGMRVLLGSSVNEKCN